MKMLRTTLKSSLSLQVPQVQQFKIVKRKE